MKRVGRVLSVCAIAALALTGSWILKDQILKRIVVAQAERTLGAPVRIGGFSFGLMNQSVRITELKVFNPKGFPEGTLAEFSIVRGRFDLKELLFRRKLHVSYAEVELTEMCLVKNKDGKLNVDALKVAQRKDTSPEPADRMRFRIDILKLGIGKLVRKDYGQGTEPSVQVYDISIHKSYKNITGVDQLATLILAEPLKTAGIKGAVIYGVAMATGVGIIPVAVIATLRGNDQVVEDLSMPFDELYRTSLAVLKRMGTNTQEDGSAGRISANVHGAQVTLELKKETAGKTRMTISARKYFLPKPEVAAGVLYQIMDKLK